MCNKWEFEYKTRNWSKMMPNGIVVRIIGVTEEDAETAKKEADAKWGKETVKNEEE